MNKLLSTVAVLGLLAVPFSAEAIGTVRSPSVKENVTKFEYKAYRLDDDSGSKKNNKQSHVAEIKHGFTDRIAAGVEVYGTRDYDSGFSVDDIAVEGIYELFKPEEAMVQTALFAEYKWTFASAEAQELELGVLMQKDWDMWRARANVYTEREAGDGREHGVGVEGRGFVQYKLDPAFKPGIEYQGGFGKLNDSGSYDDNEHYLGVNAMGDIAAVDGLEYELAVLPGISDAAADTAVRWKLEYAVKF